MNCTRGTAGRGGAARRAVGLLLALATTTAFAGDTAAPAQQKEETRRAEQEAREAQLARQREAAQKAREAADRQAVAARLAQRNVWPDEQFERWVFQNDGNAATARRRFEALLTLQVEEIDRACQLSDVQKQKVGLMGHGDLKRVFDAFDNAKHRFHLLDNDMNRLQEVMPDIRPVQSSVQNGLFNDDSLLIKSLRHVLTAEQAAKYDAVAKERRAYRHRARIELAVGVLEQALPLRDAQRRDLIDLLIKETKPTRTTGMYDFYLVMYQLGRLPEDKIKPLFSAAEWKVVDRLLAQYKAVVPNLRQNGLIGDDDDVADGGAAGPER
jgi:hypothetical protein